MAVQVHGPAGARLLPHQIIGHDVNSVRPVAQLDLLGKDQARLGEFDELRLAMHHQSRDVGVVLGISGHRDAQTVGQQLVWRGGEDDTWGRGVTPGLL